MLSKSPIEVFVRPEKLSLSKECDSWLQSIKTKIARRILENLESDTDCLDRYIEFAEIEEVPGAFVACSFYQRDINDALTRAGLYMGAGKGLKAKTVAKQSDHTLLNYKKLVAGHNLPGPVVIDFYRAIAATADANDAEAAVLKNFLESPRVTALNGAFYLIGFSIQSTKDQKGVITHEVFHAYSFLNREFQTVVKDFWRDAVTSEDKTAITNEIGLAYNVDDEDIVIDEFQAYLIQTGAEKDRMRRFVPKYRDALLAKLNEANIELAKI